MKFVYKLTSIDIDTLLRDLIMSKTNSSNIINLLASSHNKRSSLLVKLPPLYCTSNQGVADSNKYVCHELLLSLMSTSEANTRRINYFLSKLESICMTHVKTNKVQLFDTDNTLVFKSVILVIDASTNQQQQGLIEVASIELSDSSSDNNHTSNSSNPQASPMLTGSSINNTSSSNHFDSDKEYLTYSDSKQIMHDYDNININGGIKIKIINSSTFTTVVKDENDKILDPSEYAGAFDRGCYVEPTVLISLWKYKNVVGLYLRPYEIQIKK